MHEGSSYFRKTSTERLPHIDDGSKVSGMELNQYVEIGGTELIRHSCY